MLSKIFPALVALFLLSSLQADDWTRFRGPNGSGLSDIKSIPVKFGESDFNWKTEVKGAGHSSPVTWKGHIYLLVADQNEVGDRSLICYSAENGKELWRVADPYEVHVSNKKLNTFASCTPVTAPEGVYFISSTGEKLSVRAVSHDGESRWQQHLPHYLSDHGSASSPILVDGVLIVNTDSKKEMKNHIYGIDAASGKILWSRERIDPDPLHKTVYSSPIVTNFAGQKAVTVVSTHHGWLGLNAKTGKTVWEHPENYRNRSVGSPVEKDGVVFATLGAGGKGKLSAALQLDPKSKGIKVLYELGAKDGLGYVPSPLFVDDFLYLWGDKGFLTCREALTGKEVYHERVGGIFFSSPVALNNRIYCLNSKGVMIVIKAGRDFEILAENDLASGGVFATPAIADGKMIIRTETHLISVGGK